MKAGLSCYGARGTMQRPPDGDAIERTVDRLHDKDFYAWSQQQA
jgi:hypothetical protein